MSTSISESCHAGTGGGLFADEPAAHAGETLTPDVTEGRGALPPVLDLTRAHALRDTVAALIARGTDVALDAAAVERMSTPCAQILLAAGRAVGPSFKIVNSSDVFRAAIADLGLQREFSKWVA
jgi:anti-anti-sigma regulatory factor